MLLRWVVVLFCGSALIAQSKPESCVLDTARNGDPVKIGGVAVVSIHDLFIWPVGCQESPANRVILVWGDDPDLAARTEVRRDTAFGEFEELLRATFPLPPNAVGSGAPRYQVQAEFEGRLDIAPSAGVKRDSRTKKVIGIEGFGHPMPFTRFRLVVTAVSSVRATELKRPIPAQ